MAEEQRTTEGPFALWLRLFRQALAQRNYLRFILIYAWQTAVNASYTAFMIRGSRPI